MSEITYHQEGNYLYPNLTAGEPEQRPILKYGALRRNYLQVEKPDLYNLLLMKGTLQSHLADIQEEAESRVEQIIKAMTASDRKKGLVPDRNERPLEWVGYMNNTQNQAEEIVAQELLYN